MKLLKGRKYPKRASDFFNALNIAQNNTSDHMRYVL